MKGGILAHSDGITFSQELGETVALVKAPGASGLALENGTGKATDWRGYTVQTQLNAYDENRVEIDSDYFFEGQRRNRQQYPQRYPDARRGGTGGVCHSCGLSRPVQCAAEEWQTGAVWRNGLG